MLDRDVEIYPHTSKDRSDRSAEEEDFFVLPIENIVGTHIRLNRSIDIIGRGKIPDIEGPN